MAAPHVVYAVDDLVVVPNPLRGDVLWPVSGRRREGGGAAATRWWTKGTLACRQLDELSAPPPSHPPPLLQGAIVDPRHAPESVRRAEPPGDALCVLLFGPPSVKVREKGEEGARLFWRRAAPQERAFQGGDHGGGRGRGERRGLP